MISRPKEDEWRNADYCDKRKGVLTDPDPDPDPEAKCSGQDTAEGQASLLLRDQYRSKWWGGEDVHV